MADKTFQQRLEENPAEAAKVISNAIREIINWEFPKFTMTREQWYKVIPYVVEEFQNPTKPGYMLNDEGGEEEGSEEEESGDENSDPEPTMITVKFMPGEHGTFVANADDEIEVELEEDNTIVIDSGDVPGVTPTSGYELDGWTPDIELPIAVSDPKQAIVITAKYKTTAVA